MDQISPLQHASATTLRRPSQDKHELYERSVQDPPGDVRTLTTLYRRYRKRDPLSLREDFCGTAALAAAWARSSRERTSIGVDLHRPTLEWGRKHRVGTLDPTAAARVRLICGDVRRVRRETVDIICALNFSYFVLKERQQLLRYFRAARCGLAHDGLLIVDILGGHGAMKAEQEKERLGGFTYIWEQETFNPLSHEFRCHIHFRSRDGKALRRAFTYDWRLWTAPEIRDLLHEAGFSAVHLLWERTDRTGKGTGAYSEPKRVENQELWWTYIVAGV